MALITTVAGLDSNSYVTVDYADTYFANHYDTTKYDAWDALTSLQKESALTQAVDILQTISFWDISNTVVFVTWSTGIEGHMRSPAVLNQALAFPRNIDITNSGVLYIPSDVQKAQCEQAIYLVTSLNEEVASARMQGLLAESIKADTVSISQKFTDGGIGINPIVHTLSPMAVTLLKKYMVSTRKARRE